MLWRSATQSGPEPFSRLRFSNYARDLAQAVYDLGSPMKFEITEPVFFLGKDRKPGDILDNPTGPYKYQPGTGKRIAQFVELPSENKPVAVAPVPPPIPTPLPSVSPITAAPVVAKPIEKSMSITGLQSGAFKAMLADMRKEIADAQNQGVADVKATVVEARTEITTAVAGVKEKVRAEVADALQEFSTFTNGGPA